MNYNEFKDCSDEQLKIFLEKLDKTIKETSNLPKGTIKIKEQQELIKTMIKDIKKDTGEINE